MSEKKRKRESEKGDRPPKKVAFHAPETVKVQLLEDNDVLGPVIASTPGLSFPSKIALKPYKSGVVGGVLPPGKKLPAKLILHSSDHPMLDYTAREEKDGSADSLLRHYVGIYDPDSGELKLMEAHKVTVRSTLRSEEEELRRDREAAAQLKRPTIASKLETLGMEFGNKKTRKAIDDRTTNAITRDLPRLASPGGTIPPPPSDTVAAAVLSAMEASTSNMPTKDEQTAAMEEGKPRPKANLDAKIPAEVYTISSLIGNEIMGLINVKDWVDAAEAKVPVKVNSRFVAKRIQTLAAGKDIKKLKVLRFILLLMMFKDQLRQRGGRGPYTIPFRDKFNEAMGGNAPLVQALKRKFANENAELTRWHLNYLISHVCAAALIVDDFVVDTYDLKDDLKMTTPELMTLFKEIGARDSTPTDTERERYRIKSKAEAVAHRMAKLRIPLVFPKQRVMGPKRRG
ncbi:uncharacterized protein BDZ99DRAFT_461604 [Mytilinidion resinicola]|uniref:RNA polymerase I associated factor, A49-like protein n=1 Tax=Mytilinidion resinicola TaxID=574789 RepID=A0A6A6YUG3_9PEZI|nr:uncharacterized protein BDZ99DRAFT_461604 [Mytilinidion resinicola]KAF2811577.1 hypothetical protein BDZ99DRAFT_461604 [Mytilinidion resinicola]